MRCAICSPQISLLDGASPCGSAVAGAMRLTNGQHTLQRSTGALGTREMRTGTEVHHPSGRSEELLRCCVGAAAACLCCHDIFSQAGRHRNHGSTPIGPTRGEKGDGVP